MHNWLATAWELFSDQLERPLAGTLIDQRFDLNRLGEIAGLNQQVAHPDQLFHRDRHGRVDRRIALYLVENIGRTRVIRLAVSHFVGQRDDLFAIVQGEPPAAS